MYGFKKNHFEILKENKNRLLVYWFFSGILMLFVAWGELIQIGSFKIHNYFNVLYYASNFTDKFSHFRCLGRFAWITFWTTNILVAFLIDHILTYSKVRYIKVIVAIFLLGLVSETKDFVQHLNNLHKKNYLSNPEISKPITKVTDLVNANDYQAILPIPYFHTGTENFDFTIDAPVYWLNNCGQLSEITGLPLMASQLSRTAAYQAKELFSIFTDSIPNANLLQQLNDKPILVFYSKNLNAEENLWCKNEREPAKTVAYSRKNIIEKYKMKLVTETNDFLIYCWDVQKLK